MESVWKNPFLLEMKVADIISRQAKHGTQFNHRRCQWLIHTLNEKITVIDHELVPMLPKMLNKGTSYSKPFLKSGGFAKFPGVYAERVGLKREEVGGPFTAVWYTPFDTGKTDKVKSEMFNMGWMPTEWNSKKMPFQTYRYRKRLQRISYKEFMQEWDPVEAQEMDTLVQGYINNHFTGRSRGYMKALVHELGFKGKKAPTFDAIKKRLISNPFWPTSAKITEESFNSLPEGSRVGLLLKQRGILSHRRSFLKGLVEKYHERGDGKLSGEANPCATPTARMRHKIIVNVPAGRAVLGKQCRGLFTGDYNGESPSRVIRKYDPEKVKQGLQRKCNNFLEVYNDKKDKWERSGYWCILIPAGHDAFVGGDGAGLELRMLTHYLISVSKTMLAEAEEAGNKAAIDKYSASLKSAYEYKEILLTGDIHSHNQHLAGLPTRDAAKTFIYAFLYGAGDANLGGQLGADAARGSELRATFLRECPCIPVLIEWVQDHAKKHGWVPALDGRKLIMRRDEHTGEVMSHKALNTMLQAAGSIVMKYASVFLDNWNKRDRLSCHEILFVHDEIQFTCKWEDVTRLRANIDRCVAKAGEHLDMDCELASDSMFGANWYHTH
ncbi:MAG: DNA polymerase [Bacteroidales bacterium]